LIANAFKRKGGSGGPILENGTVRCAGSSGIAGLCFRK
jgi:hypothetical protein